MKKQSAAFVVADFGAYWYHRAAHTRGVHPHRIHHDHPSETDAMVSAAQCSALIAASTALCIRASGHASHLLCPWTIVAYWASVTLVHPLLHLPGRRVGYVGWMQAFHEVHHRAPATNFGVYTPCWDWLFATLHPRVDS